MSDTRNIGWQCGMRCGFPVVFSLLLMALADPILSDIWVDRYDDPFPIPDTCDLFTNDDCSLRGAILYANSHPEASIVKLFPGTYVLTIQGSEEGQGETGDLDITDDITVQGPDGDMAIINASALGDRAFDVHGVAHATLSSLFITGGQTQLGPVFLDGAGGGVRSSNRLTLDRVTVAGNTAANVGGGICSNTLTMSHSTVSGNLAAGPGGGIYLLEKGDITNSTISGNTAHSGGGIAGPWMGYEDALSLTHVTLAANTAGSGVGSAIDLTQGDSEAVLTNALIAGDCVGGVSWFTSMGGNLESPGDTCGLDHPTDQSNVASPGLRPLANYGGPTDTHALMDDSAAINAAFGCPPEDQRFASRAVGAPCDSGAYEHGPIPPGQWIFADGFESGDSLAWSQSVP